MEVQVEGCYDWQVTLALWQKLVRHIRTNPSLVSRQAWRGDKSVWLLLTRPGECQHLFCFLCATQPLWSNARKLQQALLCVYSKNYSCGDGLLLLPLQDSTQTSQRSEILPSSGPDTYARAHEYSSPKCFSCSDILGLFTHLCGPGGRWGSLTILAHQTLSCSLQGHSVSRTKQIIPTDCSHVWPNSRSAPVAGRVLLSTERLCVCQVNTQLLVNTSCRTLFQNSIGFWTLLSVCGWIKSEELFLIT